MVPQIWVFIFLIFILKIGSANVSRNRPTNVDPQTLLKIGSTIVTGNSPINVDPQTLLKIGSTKRYSKLVPQALLETDPQMFLRINSTSVSQN